MTDPADPFSLLAPPLQRAIWDMRWPSLRPIQRDAIRAWHDPASPDLLIMAQTAGGKTEAAFLPVLSHIAADPDASVRALYIGPLKALINDQFQRLELLCRHMHLPVHRWHGDVGDSAKAALTTAPSGVLLITPESLESLLINRTTHLPRLFSHLAAIVIDELHAFLASQRGLHLASLLARLTPLAASRPRRIGLSATIGDPPAAARYLNPDAPETVRTIESKGEEKQLLLRIHWHEPTPDARAQRPDPETTRAIAAELVHHFHASSNLVFCNSKADIELLADAANTLCRARALEERFHVHHASISRAHREDAEAEMKDPAPDTALCSSTLEMGIDIGSVRTVAQVGPPWSVASLKQRVGRSGRKDSQPRRLRIFLTDEAQPDQDTPDKRLPLDLLQTIAVLELMLTDRWVEPSEPPRLDLSTLTQQIVSTIAQHSALTAPDLHARLCVDGPFRDITPALFARTLRSLGKSDILEQTAQGHIILGLAGERLRAERDFYAAFATPREYTVRAAGATLGTLPILARPQPADHLILAGRRWQVESIDDHALEIAVTPARTAKAPLFSGSPADIHPHIRAKMLDILAATPANSAGQETATLPYLDPGARAALDRARATAARDALARRRIIEDSPARATILAWTGTRAQTTLIAALAHHNITAHAREISITCQAPADAVRAALLALADNPPDPLTLARHIQPKAIRKFDQWLEDDLLDESIAADRLDLPTAITLARGLN